MSNGMEDSLNENDLLFQSYYQELQLIFNNVDASVIKSAILDYKEWDAIVQALIQKDDKKDRFLDQNEQEYEEPERQTSNLQFGFPTNATVFETQCRLYLPESLISIDMDLDLFGNFEQSDIKALQQKPYIAQSINAAAMVPSHIPARASSGQMF